MLRSSAAAASNPNPNPNPNPHPNPNPNPNPPPNPHPNPNPNPNPNQVLGSGRLLAWNVFWVMVVPLWRDLHFYVAHRFVHGEQCTSSPTGP